MNTFERLQAEKLSQAKARKKSKRSCVIGFLCDATAKLTSDSSICCDSNGHHICLDCLLFYVDMELDKLEQGYLSKKSGGIRITCPRWGLAKGLVRNPLYSTEGIFSSNCTDRPLNFSKIVELIGKHSHDNLRASSLLDRLVTTLLKDCYEEGFGQGLSNGMLAKKYPHILEAKAIIEAVDAKGRRMQYYTCKKCGHGPVYIDGCPDMTAHHGQLDSTGRGNMNNACSKCGNFPSSREAGWKPYELPSLDSLLPLDETKANAKAKVKFVQVSRYNE